MPLQDSFKRKTAGVGEKSSGSSSKSQISNQPPSISDLQHGLLTAQANVRQPVVITWRRAANESAYLLTITRNSEAYEPTWLLHVDEDNRLTVLWSYNTSDPELIYSLITEQVNQAGPAAIIPESLRPKTEEELRAEQENSAKQSYPQISNDYEIISVIGRGGMGMIYKARHKTTGMTVAMKVLHAHLLSDPTALQRFHQEAAAARSLDHPNLIRVIEFGVSRRSEPFLIMDFLEGVELQSVLNECGRLELPRFVNIFTQICDALSYAHRQGLVHRDIKPGNLMLIKGDVGHDNVKIIDFGIAKMLGEHASAGKHITTTGELLGSPAYMSPEQCGGAVLDSRSDIYSLGCVMYESISGVLPFDHESTIKTILMQVNDSAPLISEICPEIQIPPELERIILKALEKDPRQRYQTAAELGSDLWEFAATGYSSNSHTPGAPTRSLQPAPAATDEADRGARAFSLLKLAGILNDEVVEAALVCERMVDAGQLTKEQSVRVIGLVRNGTRTAQAIKLVQI